MMMQSTLLAELEAAFQRAVTAEVESQLTGIKQHFANTVGELATKVAALETRLVEDFVQTGDLPDFDGFLTKGDYPDADDIVTKDELPELPDADDIVTKDELADLVNENIEGRSFTIRF